MKSKIIILLLIGLSFNAFSQRKIWKKYTTIGSSMIVSGMLDGTIEAISWHYSGFKRVFPNSNDKFWDPSISWTNKYKNNNYLMGPKFLGSTTVFAWSTDGYHMLRTTNRLVDFGTMAYYVDKEYQNKAPRKLKVRRWLGDLVFISVMHSIGFTICYDLIFKR